MVLGAAAATGAMAVAAALLRAGLSLAALRAVLWAGLWQL